MRLDGRGAEPVTVCGANIIWREARSGTKKEQSFSELLYGSPNWVSENKTIENRFIEAKSTKQGVTEEICDLRTLRLCDLTGAERNR